MKNIKIAHIYNNRVCQVVLCLLVVMLSVFSAHAQQDSQYTQYMYNAQTINPAYAGSREVLSITSLYRNQWIGLDGAPETLNFSINAPMGYQQKVGLALNFTKDKIGPADQSTIAADFAYNISFNGGTYVAFGLKGGVNLLNVDYSKLNIYNPSDAVQQFNIDNRITPIMGAGLYLHNNKTWYAGVSVPNLLETTHYDDTTVSNASEKATFYAIGGYVMDVNSAIKFKPAILGKFVKGAPLAIDLSANFLFNDTFTLGAAYRLDVCISGLAGFQVSDELFIGYTYDYGMQDLANYNSGSHEIFLRFELTKTLERLITPRFF